MGKKRKAGSQASGNKDSIPNGDAGSKLRINTYEDVADSEDEFHINRDKILLEEGPAQKRQRKLRAEEEFLEPSDEEVLAVSEISSEVEDDYQDAEEDFETSKQESKLKGPGKVERDSDSEASDALEDDEDAEGWGTSKNDYYDADVIQTEADALEEEKEARRLQQKQLQDMTETDFGLDAIDWKTADKDGVDENNDGRGKVVREILPALEITESMSVEERLDILRTRYPEFEPLAKEFRDLQSVYESLRTTATQVQALKDHLNANSPEKTEDEEMFMPVEVIKYTSLGAYLAALSVYFALFTSIQGANGKLVPMPPSELQNHPIMDTLVKCRDLWQKVKDIKAPEPTAQRLEARTSNGTKDKDAAIPNQPLSPNSDQPNPKKKKPKKSLEAAQNAATALHTQQLLDADAELASLSTLPNPLRSSKKPHKPISTSTHAHDSDSSSSSLGEPTTLNPHEAALKASHKKSLRFYTSQIAQKAIKRGSAGRDAGGDADIPYRERLKDRQERLNAEAEKRGKKSRPNSKGDEVLGGESDEDDRVVARKLRAAAGAEAETGNGDDEEDYYNTISSLSASKKSAKRALATAHAQAAQICGSVRVVDNATVGEDGKRGISYQIEKNKGITPTRKKDVRNPRVKKRKKYEDKKKKLSSIRPVYKGGEGKGGYGGEKTGIKKGLVKSVKL